MNTTYPPFLFVVRTAKDAVNFMKSFRDLYSNTFPEAETCLILYSPDGPTECKPFVDSIMNEKGPNERFTVAQQMSHRLGITSSTEDILEEVSTCEEDIIICVTHQSNLVQVPMILSEKGYKGWRGDRNVSITPGSFYFASRIQTKEGESKTVSFFPAPDTVA